MDGNTERMDGRQGSRVRIVAWSVAGLLLLTPLVGMLLTDQVDWDLFDFALLASMLLGVGVAFELAAKMSNNASYRAGAAIALGTVFFMVWSEIAVGIVGASGDPANLMYGGVLAVGILGALLARFQPAGMARALFATALAQVLVGAIVLVLRLGTPSNDPVVLLWINSMFAALWGASAGMFRRAATQTP